MVRGQRTQQVRRHRLGRRGAQKRHEVIRRVRQHSAQFLAYRINGSLQPRMRRKALTWVEGLAGNARKVQEFGTLSRIRQRCGLFLEIDGQALVDAGQFRSSVALSQRFDDRIEQLAPTGSNVLRGVFYRVTHAGRGGGVAEPAPVRLRGIDRSQISRHRFVPASLLFEHDAQAQTRHEHAGRELQTFAQIVRGGLQVPGQHLCRTQLVQDGRVLGLYA